ncbi:myelin-oligodendrocyte glycoprotein-like [Excalfactoria chinensis]|uniref:myelin-oligodendrocyte glycoprotein-like n=1 Tax=Excalfactoria chinensis TaxID=46218 RepID=UPI003B3B004F
MGFTSRCSHGTFTLSWRTLLAHLMTLQLLHLVSAQFRVVAPNLHVTAYVGQDIVLHCQLSPCMDAWSSDIRWIQHRSAGLVHHYQNGLDLEQMEEYNGRTELLRNGLSDGNLDLRITAVSSSDSGTYSCVVQDGDAYAEALLNLEVSDPFSQITHPWKVALALVVTLLVGSSVVIIVFLHRKQERKNAQLEKKDAELAQIIAIFGESSPFRKKLKNWSNSVKRWTNTQQNWWNNVKQWRKNVNRRWNKLKQRTNTQQNWWNNVKQWKKNVKRWREETQILLNQLHNWLNSMKRWG